MSFLVAESKALYVMQQMAQESLEWAEAKPRTQVLHMAREAGRFDARITYLDLPPGAPYSTERLAGVLVYAEAKGVDEKLTRFAWMSGFEDSAYGHKLAEIKAAEAEFDAPEVVSSPAPMRVPYTADPYGETWA